MARLVTGKADVPGAACFVSGHAIRNTVHPKTAQPRTLWPHRKPAIRLWLGNRKIIGDAPHPCKRLSPERPISWLGQLAHPPVETGVCNEKPAEARLPKGAIAGLAVRFNALCGPDGGFNPRRRLSGSAPAAQPEGFRAARNARVTNYTNFDEWARIFVVIRQNSCNS